MNSIPYLPLGSVVIVRGNVKKFVVIARGLLTKTEMGIKYFDYGGCLYPEGIIGDAIVYFNHADIMKVVAKGYSDEDDALAVENINSFLRENEVSYGNPYEINRKNGRVDPAMGENKE